MAADRSGERLHACKEINCLATLSKSHANLPVVARNARHIDRARKPAANCAGMRGNGTQLRGGAVGLQRMANKPPWLSGVPCDACLPGLPTICYLAAPPEIGLGWEGRCPSGTEAELLNIRPAAPAKAGACWKAARCCDRSAAALVNALILPIVYRSGRGGH